MPNLVLQSVSKHFGSVEAVRRVDLQVQAGELVTLVGPSGCGKTTTLRVIAGLEEQTSGSIQIGDRCVDGVPPRDRNVAMVFQDDALQPHLTVGRNLAFGLQMRGAAKSLIQQRVEAITQQFGLNDWLARMPHQLSGGQRQRVALARSLVRDPDVLLFDEPLSNLDAPTRAELRTELARRRATFSCAALYVTHDQAEALSLADRMAVMNQGRIEQTGTPRQVYERPRTCFVAQFIGSPAMNILPVEATTHQGQHGVRLASTFVPFTDTELLESADDGKLLLGIRPEDLRLASETDGDSTISATTTAVQYTGPEIIAECQVESSRLMARFAADANIQPAQSIRLRLPPERCHYFDAKTGERCVTRTSTS